MTQPITILNAHIPTLLQALTALDGRKEVVVIDGADGKEKRALTTIPYVFTGRARLTAGQWIAAIRGQAEILNKAHDDTVRQYATAETPNVVAPENDAKFHAVMAAMDATPFEVSLPKIAYDDLNVEENKIPVTVIGVLVPILA